MIVVVGVGVGISGVDIYCAQFVGGDGCGVGCVAIVVPEVDVVEA